MEFCFAEGSGKQEMDFIAEGVQRCPFLRNISKPTSFSLTPFSQIETLVKPARGPIFEDGPNFDLAFRLFHGHDGVVPLSERFKREDTKNKTFTNAMEAPHATFHPLAASTAAISISAFGQSGPFGFDAFKANLNRPKNEGKKSEKKKSKSEQKPTESSGQMHEALSNEWLATGNCPIAKSYRAMNGVLPLVAKLLQPSSGMKVRCPPAIVAARAALAKTPAVKALKPQPLPTKVMAVGFLGVALNVPLGIWREHTEKFSPSWFVAVHASVPFIAMMRKAVHMPKYAMAFTIAASILGQVIGSRAERIRLAHAKEMGGKSGQLCQSNELLTAAESLDKMLPVPTSMKLDFTEERKNASNAPRCSTETWNIEFTGFSKAAEVSIY